MFYSSYFDLLFLMLLQAGGTRGKLVNLQFLIEASNLVNRMHFWNLDSLKVIEFGVVNAQLNLPGLWQLDI